MNDKEVRIPVVSHHCRITHSACDCVLRRLKLLEAVAEAARWFLVPSSECDETLSQLELNLAAALGALEKDK